MFLPSKPKLIFQIILLLLFSSPLWAEEFTGKVVGVSDGDTIKVMYHIMAAAGVCGRDRLKPAADEERRKGNTEDYLLISKAPGVHSSFKRPTPN
jgi:hypothetical protein